MNNLNQTYNPGQMSEGVPPMPQPPKPLGQGVWQRIKKVPQTFPKWLSQYAIVVYILALAIVGLMYSAYSMSWYYMLSGITAVLVFFLYGSTVIQNTFEVRMRKEKVFEKRLFFIALVPRVLCMLLLYEIFMSNYGNAFGFECGDATYYDELGQFVSELLKNSNFHFYDEIAKWSGNDDVADMGYGIYVGLIYWMTGNSIIAVRFIKCILSSITILLVYRLAKRNFGEQIGRVAAIFCTLWPNFWYYCAVHLKETEMVFLAVLFVEQADQMLRSRNFTAWKVIPVLLIAAAMFTVRTPLGLVALLALVFSVVMSSSKVVSWGKRIIVGILAVLLVGVIAGNRIQEKAMGLIEAQSSAQKEGINWYATRKDGNGLAKYAGTAVFAPMIFTLPFPSMVRPFEGQEVQQFLNGGNFVKNIMSAFTILAMVTLLMSGRWREHMMPLSFMLGYLAVLALSSFAHSERFHQPAMPFEFMFAAYGLSIALTKPKYKRWFTYWCVLMFVAAIAWNWFKLKGRGL